MIEAFLSKMVRVAHFFPVRPNGRPLLLMLALGGTLSMVGCASPITLYHDAEGGDIASLRQAPPGADLPYPNLASVPAAPVALSQSQQQAVRQQLEQAKAAPEQPTSTPAPASSEALADLALPSSVPPEPRLPGIQIPSAAPAPAVVTPVAPVAPVASLHEGAPIALAFAPKSAILSPDMVTALQALAASRGSAKVRVGGFGEQDSAVNAAPDAAALSLALVRARRIADALTADGVPGSEITLVAAASGYGGFAQLVY